MSESEAPTTPPLDDDLPETPSGTEARLARLEKDFAKDRAERPERYRKIADEARRVPRTDAEERDIFDDIFG